MHKDRNGVNRAEQDLSNFGSRGGEEVQSLFKKARAAINDVIGGLTPPPKPKPQGAKLRAMFDQTRRGIPAGDWGSFMAPVSAPGFEQILTNRTTQFGFAPPKGQPAREVNFDGNTLATWTGARIPEGAIAYYPFTNDAKSMVKWGEEIKPQPKANRFHDGAYLRKSDWSSSVKAEANKAGVKLTKPRGSSSLGSVTCHFDYTMDVSGPILACDQLKIETDVWGGVIFHWPDRKFRVNADRGRAWHKMIFSIDILKQEMRVWIDGRFFSFELDKVDTYVDRKWVVQQLPPLKDFAYDTWRFAANDEKGRLKSAVGLVDEILFFDRAMTWSEMGTLNARPRLTDAEFQELRGGKLATLLELIQDTQKPREDPGHEWFCTHLWTSMFSLGDKNGDGRLSEDETGDSPMPFRTLDEMKVYLDKEMTKLIDDGKSSAKNLAEDRISYLVGSYRSRLDKALVDVVQMLDSDRDSKLSEKEAQRMLTIIDRDDVDFNALDLDKNGVTDAKEIGTALKTILDIEFKPKPNP